MLKKVIFYLSLLIVLIFFDQFFKQAIIHQIKTPFICNKFFSFGINISFGYLGIILFLWLSFFFWQRKNIIFFLRKKRGTQMALAFILAGAISNLIDRVKQGCVIDFINIHILNYPWFNLADIFIVIGSFYLGLLILINKKEILNT